MSQVVGSVTHLFNDIFGSVVTIGHDLVGIVMAIVSTVVHFATSAANAISHFVFQNLSLIFLLAVAFVGYQLYQGGAVSSGKSRKKLR